MYCDGNTVFCREIDAISKCMMNLSQVKRNSVAPCSLCCSSQIINLRVNLWEHPFPRCYGTLLCSLKNWHVSLASGGQRNHLWKQQPLISCFFFHFCLWATCCDSQGKHLLFTLDLLLASLEDHIWWLDKHGLVLCKASTQPAVLPPATISLNFQYADEHMNHQGNDSIYMNKYKGSNLQAEFGNATENKTNTQSHIWMLKIRD